MRCLGRVSNCGSCYLELLKSTIAFQEQAKSDCKLISVRSYHQASEIDGHVLVSASQNKEDLNELLEQTDHIAPLIANPAMCPICTEIDDDATISALQNKVNLNELLEQTLEKDEAWQEEYVSAFSDIDDARLAAQEQIPLGLGEEFFLEKASEQLPPEKVSDYTEAQLRGEEQIEMKKRQLANPRFDERGEPLDVKKRREIARARIQADAEKKREAYVQRVQALESKREWLKLPELV